MKKLADAYRANPNRQNAEKLVRYVDRHMMAMCCASADDQILVSAARITLAGEKI